MLSTGYIPLLTTLYSNFCGHPSDLSSATIVTRSGDRSASVGLELCFLPHHIELCLLFALSVRRDVNETDAFNMTHGWNSIYV